MKCGTFSSAKLRHIVVYIVSRRPVFKFKLSKKAGYRSTYLFWFLMIAYCFKNILRQLCDITTDIGAKMCFCINHIAVRFITLTNCTILTSHTIFCCLNTTSSHCYIHLRFSSKLFLCPFRIWFVENDIKVTWVGSCGFYMYSCVCRKRKLFCLPDCTVEFVEV